MFFCEQKHVFYKKYVFCVKSTFSCKKLVLSQKNIYIYIYIYMYIYDSCHFYFVNGEEVREYVRLRKVFVRTCVRRFLV